MVGPLYHVGAFDLPGLAVLQMGGLLAVLREFEPEPTLALIERERLTAAWMAPVMLNRLLALPERGRFDLSSLRWQIGGGERTPEERIREPYKAVYRWLSRMSEGDFAKRNACHVHLVAHPRKGKDESGTPGKMDVAGSSKITDGADNVFSVWSARKDESAPTDDSPDGGIELQKQRNGEIQHFKQALWFNKAAMQFTTNSRRKAISFVHYERPAEAHAM